MSEQTVDVALTTEPGWYIIYANDGKGPYECAQYWGGRWYFVDRVTYRQLPAHLTLGPPIDTLMARRRKRRVKRNRPAHP